MKSGILVIVISFCLSPLCSQNEEFEVGIEYCFEYFMKLSFAYKSSNTAIHQSCNTETVKVNFTKKNFSPYAFLAWSIYESLLNSDLEGYEIESGKKYLKEEIENLYSVVDTVTTFNPETYKATISHVRNLRMSDFNWYKINQKWKINRNQIDIEVRELIPLKDQKIGKYDLLKIPMKKATTAESIINNPEIDWVKTTEESVPISAFGANSLQILKRVLWENPKNGLIPIYEYDQNIHVKNRRIDSKNFYIEIAQTTTDTVVTYDPETYAETINLVTNKGISFNDIAGFRIQQAWYFNSKESTLGCILLGICPLIEIRGIQGDTQLVPLYMVVNRELK